MEESRFFRLVWRFNSLVLCVAGIMAIAVLSFGGYKILKEVTGEKNVRNIVNIEGEQPAETRFQLGRIMDIPGSPYVMVPLYSDQNYAQSYYSKSSQSTRNHLFIDVEGSARHWLFETNDYLIADTAMLSEEEYGEKERRIRAILYSIIKADSNGDSRLTGKDALTIALIRPDGRDYKEVLTDIDFLVGYKMIGADALFLIYQRNGSAYSVNVNLSDFTIRNEVKLAMVKSENLSDAMDAPNK